MENLNGSRTIGFMRIKPLELGLATLLTNIAKVVGNYGIAIILTILVRLILIPLT